MFTFAPYSFLCNLHLSIDDYNIFDKIGLVYSDYPETCQDLIFKADVSCTKFTNSIRVQICKIINECKDYVNAFSCESMVVHIPAHLFISSLNFDDNSQVEHGLIDLGSIYEFLNFVFDNKGECFSFKIAHRTDFRIQSKQEEFCFPIRKSKREIFANEHKGVYSFKITRQAVNIYKENPIFNTSLKIMDACPLFVIKDVFYRCPQNTSLRYFFIDVDNLIVKAYGRLNQNHSKIYKMNSHWIGFKPLSRWEELKNSAGQDVLYNEEFNDVIEYCKKHKVQIVFGEYDGSSIVIYGSWEIYDNENIWSSFRKPGPFDKNIKVYYSCLLDHSNTNYGINLYGKYLQMKKEISDDLLLKYAEDKDGVCDSYFLHNKIDIKTFAPHSLFSYCSLCNGGSVSKENAVLTYWDDIIEYEERENDSIQLKISIKKAYEIYHKYRNGCERLITQGQLKRMVLCKTINDYNQYQMLRDRIVDEERSSQDILIIQEALDIYRKYRDCVNYKIPNVNPYLISDARRIVENKSLFAPQNFPISDDRYFYSCSLNRNVSFKDVYEEFHQDIEEALDFPEDDYYLKCDNIKILFCSNIKGFRHLICYNDDVDYERTWIKKERSYYRTGGRSNDSKKCDLYD